ncbi:hypothetical protein LBMAG42_16600 [Deltaproteobacteria bacterium]|nr:hypothetical protein LBMAG42_16600 [Deltaproteobacteria bacterium]
MRRGARDLNLEVRWRRRFVPVGTVADPTPDGVWLDVGGRLQPGMLDAHQGGSATTAELVVRHPELAYGHLMSEWLRRYDDGQDLRGRTWSPTLILHTEPDFDCVVATFLVERLVEEGALPDYAPALAAYSAEVDAGRYPIDLAVPASYTAPVHMAYLLLQRLKRDLGLDDTAILELGAHMVATVCEAIVRAKGRAAPWDFTPHRLPAGALDGGQRAAVEVAARAWEGVVSRHERAGTIDLAAALADQPALFAEDRQAMEEANRVVGRPVTARLPAADGGEPLDVAVWVAPAPTRCALNKYFVRAAGYPYFICPIATPNALPGYSGRVIISLDAAYADAAGRRPTLRGLGYRLECLETARRARSDPRIPVPRWPDGSVQNDDPWYDGRGHDHTIVDSPRCGTALADREVVDVALGGEFWKLRLEAARLMVVMAAPGATALAGEVDGVPEIPGLAPAVQLWRARACHRRVPAVARSSAVPPLPPLFERSGEFVRLPPEGLAVEGRAPPALRVCGIVARPGATMDDIAAWVERAAPTEGVLHVVAILQPERGGSLDRRAQLYSRLCLGEAAQMPGNADHDIVLLNGRVVAMNLRDEQDDGAYTRTVCELMLYAAFQESALSWFSGEIAKAVESGAGSSALRRAFLLFRTQYQCSEPTLLTDARRAYQAVIGAIGLERDLEKVTAEMRSLEQIDQDREEEGRRGEEASRRRVEAFLNGVLGVVAVTGIVEAVGIDWRALATWQWVVMALGVLSATALIVPRVRRLMRDAGPTPGRPRR